MPGSKKLLNIKFFNSRLAFARGANNRGHVIEVLLERAAPGHRALAKVGALAGTSVSLRAELLLATVMPRDVNPKANQQAACPLLGVGASGREVGTEVMVAWALAYIKALCV